MDQLTNEPYMDWDSIPADKRIETESGCLGAFKGNRCKMGILKNDGYYYRCGMIANKPDIYCPKHGGRKKDNREQVEIQLEKLRAKQKKTINYINQELRRLEPLEAAVVKLRKGIEAIEALRAEAYLFGDLSDAPVCDIELAKLGAMFKLYKAAFLRCAQDREVVEKINWLEEHLDHIYNMLTPREGLVLRFRFGLGDGHVRTLEAIGQHLDLCAERIRQIEHSALRKLKHPLHREYLLECTRVLSELDNRSE